jgi:hypothetical protein
MDQNLAQDIRFTHGLINYLVASYQGRMTFFSSLDSLAYQGTPLEEIDRSRKVFDRALKWKNSIWKHELLFSSAWKTPESFESENTVDSLLNLLPELENIARALLQILVDPKTPDSPEQIKFLIAAYARHAYGQEYYIRGFLEYATVLSDPKIAAQFNLALPGALDEVESAKYFITSYNNAQVPLPSLLGLLQQVTLLLPCVFRTHIHDINLLTAPLRGGVGLEQIGFDEAEAARWQQIGLSPGPAGYWRAYGMSPDESATWIQNGFTAAAIAAPWRFRQFTPAVAISWVQRGFSAQLAQPWFQAGSDPDQALGFIQQGVEHPAQLKR